MLYVHTLLDSDCARSTGDCMFDIVQILTSVPPTPLAVSTTVQTPSAVLSAVATMATNWTVTDVSAQVCL